MLRGFDYVRAGSVNEGCALLAGNEGGAILAGGTDLLVNIRNNVVSPRLLVDLKGIDELSRLSFDGGVRIGANVPLNAIAENSVIREGYSALGEAASSVGSYQVRNRATLAGNQAGPRHPGRDPGKHIAWNTKNEDLIP